MLDNNVIQSISAWPFVEIRKLLKERKDLINTKKKIIFQTKWKWIGPSVGCNRCSRKYGSYGPFRYCRIHTSFEMSSSCAGGVRDAEGGWLGAGGGVVAQGRPRVPGRPGPENF